MKGRSPYARGGAHTASASRRKVGNQQGRNEQTQVKQTHHKKRRQTQREKNKRMKSFEGTETHRGGPERHDFARLLVLMEEAGTSGLQVLRGDGAHAVEKWHSYG